MLGALVIESTGCALAEDALAALELAGQLFDRAFAQARSPSITGAFRRLLQRARDAMAAHAAHRPPNPHLNPCAGSGPDELAVLGGRQAVITAPCPAPKAPEPAKAHALGLPTVDYAHGFYGPAVQLEAPYPYDERYAAVYAAPPQGEWQGHNHIWGAYVSALMPPEHAEGTS
ncbi:hypothetical protein HWV62_35859 [Athelia sp. TMB]|nr:hypothetical protein HWV62_35859 [Athelia sp. TMB]